MAGQLKINGVTLATEDTSVITLENPQIKDSSNNLVLDQSGSRPLLKNVDIKDSSNNLILDQSGSKSVLKNVEVVNDSPLMFRNRIINGDMRITQRGTSFTNIGSVGSTSYSAYSADRFLYTNISSVAKISVSNETTDVPSGFKNAAKVQVTTADAAPAASHYANLYYAVEAQDLSDLQYGSSGAKNLTFSFYAKSSSSAAGTYQYNFLNNNASRMIARTFTVTDSWQKFIMYIPGDTNSLGVIPNDNSAGFRIILQLDSGANQTGGTTPTNWSTANLADRGVGTNVSFLSNTSNEFYITGVQLEVGNQATPFEHIPYGLELGLCQRYYHRDRFTNYRTAILDGNSSEVPTVIFHLPVEMRTSPTVSKLSSAALYYNNGGSANFTPSGGTPAATSNNRLNGMFRLSTISNPPGSAHSQKFGQWNIQLEFSAEL